METADICTDTVEVTHGEIEWATCCELLKMHVIRNRKSYFLLWESSMYFFLF